MKAFDFLYDNKNLSDFGLIICNFGDKNIDTVSDGAEILFNTVSVQNGSKHELTSVEYEDCLETTIQICKYSCSSGIQEITEVEHRQLTRWLNRKKFLKFKLLDNAIIIYFCNHIRNKSINIIKSRIQNCLVFKI